MTAEKKPQSVEDFEEGDSVLAEDPLHGKPLADIYHFWKLSGMFPINS
jgi:hypothetical protein